jgi:hypothetical protein
MNYQVLNKKDETVKHLWTKISDLILYKDNKAFTARISNIKRTINEQLSKKSRLHSPKNNKRSLYKKQVSERKSANLQNYRIIVSSNITKRGRSSSSIQRSLVTTIKESEVEDDFSTRYHDSGKKRTFKKSPFRSTTKLPTLVIKQVSILSSNIKMQKLIIIYIGPYVKATIQQPKKSLF